MILIRYSFCTLLLCLLIAVQTVRAQCTTEAGTLNTTPQILCEGASLSVAHNNDQTLDGDDILIFVAYTGSAPNATTVFATSTDGNFPYQGSFLANSPFKVAAVAGNDAGGAMDWDDPCLSVSNAVNVTYMPPPQITVSGGLLTCFNSFVVVNTTVNQPDCFFQWSNGNTTPVITIQQPGTYCITVTNQAGCTATECVTILADATIPVADAGPDVTTGCVAGSITLDGSGSSQGPEFVYEWIGPNGFNANQLSLVFNFGSPPAGTFILTVTNIVNGCTATDATQVLLTDPPSANAGPDSGIPCGGGTTTLTASGGPGSVTYAWTGPGNFNSILQNPIVSTPGTYTIIVTDVNTGCTATDQVTVFPGPAIPQQDFEVTDATCQGLNDGSINLSMSLGQSPYEFEWTGPASFTANTEDIDNLAPAQYSIVVTDDTGCSYYANVTVEAVTTLIISANVGPLNCIGNNGSIALAVTGGTPPYLYQWNTGATGQGIQGLGPGTYTATVTDVNGCTAVTPPITIVQPSQLVVTVGPVNCGDNTAQIFVSGGTAPYTYQWSNGANGPIVSNLPPGTYTVTVTDANGCMGFATITIGPVGNPYCGFITGQVWRDSIDNCLSDPGEQGIQNWIVRADASSGATYYGVTDASGVYNIGVEEGDYTLTLIPPNALWEPCVLTQPLGAVTANDTVEADDFFVQAVAFCPALSVSIGTSLLRRCFSNNLYFVDYCNDGTAPAEDAYVIVTLDPLLSPVSSSLPYTNLGNNELQFNVGDLNVGECGLFSIQVQVSCDAALGQTHCTEAHIYPDSSCLPNDPLWSGASLQVNSRCDADSVRFIIKNIGAADMVNSVEYVIIEDAVMLMAAPLQPLGAGDSVILSFPANGSTWHLEVDQVEYHPGNSQPSLSVEGCSSTPSFSTGFVAQFSVNDADPWIDIDCTANIGSFDPNDKQGFPVGYGSEHYIRPGTELEYLIRFQNTGTDTAFTVRVLDTLSAWLDPATIRPGASSHQYQFNLTGPGIVEFLFEDILLPDSNVNEPASNGFVKFSILPRTGAPLETVIENDAAIYFDFNEPVITNTTFHRLGENFVVRAWQPFVPGADVTVAPNPFSDEALLTVKGLRNNAPLRLRVFDLQGQVVNETETTGTVFHLRKGDWPAGVYLFQISQNGAVIGSGKLAVK
ncbi:MAG: T9SS C-terminal target domain-containing protein [Haliscomenobacteraceae bacterium CHB4]|nr:hypothetical protein [Saprospiraceae bacterium]MCE7922808.1 T9SS C-terminal target domain-containing protein [Haliscomenobacteraceae bacterium CHB4]